METHAKHSSRQRATPGMKRWLLSSALLATSLVMDAPVISTARAAETTSELGPELMSGKNDAEWLPLLKAMAAKGGVYAPFEEHRWFPFKKEPVVLKGEMRLSPDLGLSLRYTEPEQRMMIVDAKGMVQRDAKGRSKEAPADAADAGMAMLPVLRFDLPALEKLFEVHAKRTGETWRFDLVARPNTAVARMGKMIVLGEGEAVKRLEFRRSATQRVEIIIGEPRTGVTFTDDEQRKFFR